MPILQGIKHCLCILTGEEADNDQSDDSGVLADLVHAHVEADEEKRDGQANQADDRHGLGRLKPICNNEREIKG